MEKIRNIVLLSHSGAGKTSLAEAALFTAGAVSRLGKVDEGTATADYEPEEAKRKISINLALLPCTWRNVKLNIIDTPGYADFAGDVGAALAVVEGAIIPVSAVAGIEVGTELVWSHCEDTGLPRIIFINKMDRENANFRDVVANIQDKFGNKCLPFQLPIGTHNTFTGVIDLLTMKAYMGDKAEEADIPADLKAEAESLKEKLVEAAAEVDDSLIEKYLGGEELIPEEIISGLKRAVESGSVVPVVSGSALQNVGLRQLMDAIVDYMPAPGLRPLKTDDGSTNVTQSDDATVAALVFKTTADPYVGRLTYFRVFSGVIKSNSHIWNSSRNTDERLGQLFLMRGKEQEAAVQVVTGDIGAVAKLAITATGDTLTSQEKPIKLAAIEFPRPIYSAAVHPRTKADLDKLGTSLNRLTEEDPTLEVRRETDTGETILSGLGETQLDVVAEKMARKFGVGVDLTVPRVPYKETITSGVARAEYKHRKQTGGHGQYGHVIIKMEPLERGSGLEFASRIVGGTIPKNYIPAVEKGVIGAATEGILAGCPVVDVRVTVYDGGFHPVDSSEICFKIAGAHALRKGLAEGHPIVLEPVMNIQVTVPEEFTGDAIGDLNTKRAHVQGMNPVNGDNVIDAQVPLAEVLRYAIDIKSLTQGRGRFTMEFSHYQETPPHIQQKIVTERQAEKADSK
jgi:elongation factor G